MSKQTPEGKVKKDVRHELEVHGIYPFWEVGSGQHLPQAVNGIYWMPVQGQFAVQGVHDFCGCLWGIFFSLETKAPDNKQDETTQQGWFRVAVTECGGVALTGVRDAKAAVTELIRLVKEKLNAHQT